MENEKKSYKVFNSLPTFDKILQKRKTFSLKFKEPFVTRKTFTKNKTKFSAAMANLFESDCFIIPIPRNPISIKIISFQN